MVVPSPSIPAFSSVYFSSENGEDAEQDNSDFCITRTVVDASNAADVDTIDNSSHSAISPEARRILLGDDYEYDDDDDSLDEEFGTISPNILHDDFEGMVGNRRNGSRRDTENHHSLPHPDEVKLSAAAAGRRSLAFCCASEFKRIMYPVLAVFLAVGVVVLFTIGAIVGINNNRGSTTPTETYNPTHTYHSKPDGSGTPHTHGMYDDRLTHLQNYLVKYGVSAEYSFYDPSSGSSRTNTPQYQAVRWLAHEDHQFPVLPTHDLDPTTPEGYSLVLRYTMAVLYFATSGKNWVSDLNFLDPSKATCDWFEIFAPPVGEVGVLCNQSTQRLIGLSLISNNLVGTLPVELSQLTSMTYLESIGNPIIGTIPPEWQKLTALKTVVLAFNQLVGTLPSWMPQAWSNVEFLYLSNNMFTGTIPQEFSEFQNLSVLALDDNTLTGNTDVIWNSIESLEYVYLEDNDFTGTLPSLLSSLNYGLVNLDVSSNRLIGSIPSDIFRLNHLEILDLHGNSFDSTIPWDIPENNDRLKFLAIHKNKLEGTLPSTIANLRRLSHLDITSNKLTGTIPKELEMLSDTMTYLFVGDNDYQEGSIPSLVYALENLRELSMKNSKLTGTISGVIGALDLLLVLDLDDNNLTGSIPNEIGMLTDLQFLLLNRNQLSSSVPGESLANLEKLRFLLLDNNHLFGDLNPICGSDYLNVVYVDCGEIACLEGCCSCCMDGQACHDNGLVSNKDPVWEADYTRQFFDFSKKEGGRYYSNRDDDYWQ